VCRCFYISCMNEYPSEDLARRRMLSLKEF
jgi:hypothetical protein